MMEKLQQNKSLCRILIVLLAILTMTVTNYSKVLQGGDSITRALYWNSENLVYNAMVLNYQNSVSSPYGLSDLYPYSGTYLGGLTDETQGFFEGYSDTEYLIAVNDNENTRRQYAPGNTIIFFNG